MIRNTNDGTALPPRLRIDLAVGNLTDLPDWSKGPRGSDDKIFAAIRAAGYEGVQADPAQIAVAKRYGLHVTASGRVDKVDEADTIARRMKDAGTDVCTLHVGTGFEDDAAADALFDAIINASVKRDYPLYVETHRATITQDAWRTIKLIERHPHIRINGDFSHWYTGLEMVYGDFEKKLSLMRPVFSRVRFIHGRIGNPGCMQVDVGDGQAEGRPFVGHFRQIWTECFTGFLKSVSPGDYISFTPELLQPAIFYARTFNGREECDRWQQALVLGKIADECFDEAIRISKNQQII